MVETLPLSNKHSKGFGYEDYFKKKSYGRNIFEIMKVLALNGPKTKYAMSTFSKRPEKLTKFSWTQVHRYVTTLQRNGLVKEFGVQKIDEESKKKGKKHETLLFGLTPLGIALACLVNGDIYKKRKKIIQKYRKYEQESMKGKIGTIFHDEEEIEVFGEYNVETEWGDTEMLIHILEFTKKAIPLLPKTSAIFNAKNLNELSRKNKSVSLIPFHYFYDTLSDEIVEFINRYNLDDSELSEFHGQVISDLKTLDLYVPLIKWMKYRKNILELRSRNMGKAINALDKMSNLDA